MLTKPEYDDGANILLRSHDEISFLYKALSKILSNTEL